MLTDEIVAGNLLSGLKKRKLDRHLRDVNIF